MKKLLALVLALVMTLGLATVGASAKTTYADAKDINYTEAVDVMTAIGVLGGDANGFRPGDDLKRSEGAKIIAYLMLGSTAAEQIKGGTKYVDVPESHWAAGYIEYLTVEGVVGGIGDNKFDPDGALTTAAFTKMLLGALGYDANIEGLGGPDWMINVQRLAKQVGLFDGNDNAVASANIKREEAALYAYNMVKSPLVEYENKGSSMTVNGATINFGAGKASYKINTGRTLDRYSHIDTKVTNDNNLAQIIEFGEEYFEKLNLKGNDDVDAFGRPADVWTYDGKEIGTYPNTPDITYTAPVTLGQIYKDMGLTSETPVVKKDTAGNANKFITVANGYTVAQTMAASLYFVDGVNINTRAFGNYINADIRAWLDMDGNEAYTDADILTLKKEDSTKIGGYGTDTYVYSSDGTIRICQVNWYAGDVAAVYGATSNKEAYVTVAPRGDYGVSGDKTTSDYAVDDIVLYTISYKGSTKGSIEDIMKAETVEGDMTNYVTRGSRLSRNGNITVAGKNYEYSTMIANQATSELISRGVKVKLVLDKYGYAIDVDDIGVKNYAVVLKWTTTSGLYNSDSYAQLLLTDGTTVDAKLDGDKNPKAYIVTGVGAAAVTYTQPTYDADIKVGTSATPLNIAALTGAQTKNLVENYDIVEYAVSSSSKYTLTKLNNAAKSFGAIGATDIPIVTRGNAGLDPAFKTALTDQGSISTAVNNALAKASGSTIFLIKDKSGNYRSYEGIKNVPTIVLKNGTSAAFASAVSYKKGQYGTAAEIVFVDASNGTVSTNESIFILGSRKVGVTHNDKIGNYYEYEAYINGEKTMLKVAQSSGPIYSYTMYESISYDSNNIADLPDPSNDMRFYGTHKNSNQSIGLGDSWYPYAKDVKVFYIDEYGDVSISSIGAIPTDPDIIAWAKINNDGDVAYLYYTKPEQETVTTLIALYDALDDPAADVIYAGGAVALTEDLLVDVGQKLTLQSNLTVPAGITLTVNGRLVCGAFIVNGHVRVNGGSMYVTTGTITGNSIDMFGDNAVFSSSGNISLRGRANIAGGTMMSYNEITVADGSSVTVGGKGLFALNRLNLQEDIKLTGSGVLGFTDITVSNSATIDTSESSVDEPVRYVNSAATATVIAAMDDRTKAKQVPADELMAEVEEPDTTGMLTVGVQSFSSTYDASADEHLTYEATATGTNTDGTALTLRFVDGEKRQGGSSEAYVVTGDTVRLTFNITSSTNLPESTNNTSSLVVVNTAGDRLVSYDRNTTPATGHYEYYYDANGNVLDRKWVVDTEAQYNTGTIVIDHFAAENSTIVTNDD